MKYLKNGSRLAASAVGWYGVVAYTSAYALVSWNLLKADDLIYQLMNLTAAMGLFIVSLKKKAYESTVSNFLWGLIALVALLGIIIRGK